MNRSPGKVANVGRILGIHKRKAWMAHYYRHRDKVWVARWSKRRHWRIYYTGKDGRFGSFHLKWWEVIVYWLKMKLQPEREDD